MTFFLKKIIEVVEDNYFNINVFFIVMTTVYCMSRLIVPIQFIGGSNIITIIITLLGIVIGSINLIYKKIYLYSKNIEWLILFLIFNIFTIISVFNFGYVGNIKHTAVFFIYFFVIYSGYFVFDNREKEKFFNINIVTIVIFNTVGVIISIIQFLLLVGYRTLDFRGNLIRQGFLESRLFGIFTGPNYLAIISLLIIIYLFYKQNVCNKVYYIYINYSIILLNSIYIVLSGSRTAIICVVFILLIYFIKISKNSNYNILQKITYGLLSIIVVLSIFFTIKLSGEFYLKNNATSEEVVFINKDEGKLTLDRKDTSEENISNNRFEIWTSTIKLLPNKPFLGVSSGSWKEVSEEYDKENYVVKEVYLTHNGYLELLFYNGFLGFTVICVFVFKSLLYIINKLRSSSIEKSIFNELIMVLSLIITIMVSNMFLSSTLYGLTLLGVILFTSLGYVVSIISEDRAEYIELNIEEVKERQLKILKYIHDTCLKNNIKYSLGYGTLLGAIRHEGYIPWDDDIDIVLLRDDYEKLYSILNNSEIYRVSSYKNTKNYPLPFYRVCDDKTIYDNNMFRYSNLKLELCVDVFPLDDYKNINKEIRKLDLFRKLSSQSFLGIRNSKTIEIFNFPRYILSFICRIIPVNFIIGKINHISSVVNNDDYVDYLMEIKERDTRIKRSYFENIIDIEFESYKFKCFSDYDNVLKKWYGDDYMIPPVESERVGHAEFTAYKLKN